MLPSALTIPAALGVAANVAAQQVAPGQPAPMPPTHVLLWIVFVVIVLGALFVDLFVLHRRDEGVPKLRPAILRGSAFVALALLFCAGVAWQLGAGAATSFLTGYVVELSLSFDNLFVFLVLFKYFHVDERHQHRVLFWGILGALVLRAVFILAGVALIQNFEFVLYLFGFFLFFTGFKLLKEKDAQPDPERNAMLRLARRVIPIAKAPHEGRFFVVEDGKRMATTLFLCLLTVEASDVVFAVDSIPAIFGVTLDPFIVYTSNVFAILGLRSFYGLLVVLMQAFRYLNVGLAVVLMFIGAKMLASGPLESQFGIHIGPGVSLAVVLGTLATAVIVSLVKKPKPDAAGDPEKTQAEPE
jgi:tellurite resistance protein TerC